MNTTHSDFIQGFEPSLISPALSNLPILFHLPDWCLPPVNMHTKRTNNWRPVLSCFLTLMEPFRETAHKQRQRISSLRIGGSLKWSMIRILNYQDYAYNDWHFVELKFSMLVSKTKHVSTWKSSELWCEHDCRSLRSSIQTLKAAWWIWILCCNGSTELCV